MKLKDFQAFGANFAKNSQAGANLKFAKNSQAVLKTTENSQAAAVFKNAENLQVAVLKAVSKLAENAKNSHFLAEKAAVFAALLSLSLSLSRFVAGETMKAKYTLAKVAANTRVKFTLATKTATKLVAILAATLTPAIAAEYELSSISGCAGDGTSGCDINSVINGITYQHQDIINTKNVKYIKDINIYTQLNTFTNHATIEISGDQWNFDINGGSNSIEHFINYGSLITNPDYSLNTTSMGTGGGFKNITNYGYISGYVWLSAWEGGGSITNLTNYGVMGGVAYNGTYTNKYIVVENYGVINQIRDATQNYYFHYNTDVVLKNFAFMIDKDAAAFNAFSDSKAEDVGGSHLVFNTTSSKVSLASAETMIILDFGENFETNKPYDINKLFVTTSGVNVPVMDENGNVLSGAALLARMSVRSDLYELTLTNGGASFVVNAAPEFSTIANINKANLKTMNSFLLQSRFLSFNGEKGLARGVSSVGKGKNSRVNSSDTRLVKKTFRDKNGKKFTRTVRVKDSGGGDEWSVILAPIAGYNNFYEAGRYTLSGLEMGLQGVVNKALSSSKVGVNFGVSYANLGDKNDSEFKINSLNLMLGAQYQRPILAGFYALGRADFYYFKNKAQSFSIKEPINADNLGFSAGIYGGKDFALGFGDIAVLAGIDYKGLKTDDISVVNSSNTIGELYAGKLYNYFYADVNALYGKSFRTGIGNLAFSAALGVRGNLLGNESSMAASSVRTGAGIAGASAAVSNAAREFALIIDADRFLGYANLGLGYEFSIAKIPSRVSLIYSGNFGDKTMSNAGGVEFLMRW